MLRDYPGIGTGVPYDYLVDALGLPGACQGIAKGLPRDCLGSALRLPRDCLGIAKGLPMAKGIACGLP